MKNGKWIKRDDTSVKVGEIRYDHGQKDEKWQIWDLKGTLRYVV
jgi:hypothetical protein